MRVGEGGVVFRDSTAASLGQRSLALTQACFSSRSPFFVVVAALNFILIDEILKMGKRPTKHPLLFLTRTRMMKTMPYPEDRRYRRHPALVGHCHLWVKDWQLPTEGALVSEKVR